MHPASDGQISLNPAIQNRAPVKAQQQFLRAAQSPRRPRAMLGYAQEVVCVLSRSADIVVLGQNIGLDLRRGGKGSREDKGSNETEAPAGARGRFKLERPKIEC